MFPEGDLSRESGAASWCGTRSAHRLARGCPARSPHASSLSPLLPFLIRALEYVTLGLGPTAEAEARVLSSAALTRVLTHVYLRDPNVDLDSLLEPASGELAATAAEAVKGRAEALQARFRAFSTKPRRDAANPGAPRGEAASAQLHHQL